MLQSAAVYLRRNLSRGHQPKKNFENVFCKWSYRWFSEALFYEKIVLRVGGLSSGAIATDNEKGQTKKQTVARAHYTYTNSFSRILPNFQAGIRSTRRGISSKPIIYSDAGTFHEIFTEKIIRKCCRKREIWRFS